MGPIISVPNKLRLFLKDIDEIFPMQSAECNFGCNLKKTATKL